MADIPIIPGVKVATKGILNKPIKDIICAILFGGLSNMLKGPLLCISADLDQLIAENTDLPTIKDLQNELRGLKDQLKALEDLSGVKEMLGRVNGAIAEVQSLLALDGLCAIPLKAPKIPDILGQVIDAEFAEMNGILNDIGRLTKPQLCVDGAGGLSTGSYNPESILGSIQKRGGRMADIPGNKINDFAKRLKGVRKALDKSINRQLFPDFRHKTNLITGKPYAGEANAVAFAPPPAIQWNPPYPPVNSPNLKDATAQAQSIVSNLGKTANYPANINGVRTNNIWPGIVGPDVYALAIAALTPQDPYFAQLEPLYDYCGKFIGYNANTISGDELDNGGDAAAEAIIDPPVTNFNFVWIADRNCWAVTGVQSEQVVNGRKDVYLDKNPEIALHRGYNHILSIPSAELNGFSFDTNNNLVPASVAPEFYICKVSKVGTDLKPMIGGDGKVVKFNLGLSRLETAELLEDANGIAGDEGYQRRIDNEFGTNIYFAAENRIYSGNIPPLIPTELVWWYNTETIITKKWVLNRDSEGAVIDGDGTWVEVTEQERQSKWFGSNYSDPETCDYLAYSNENGSVFGLFKFV
jgi:hypothetical protein